jgi:hypothetical protein
VSQEINHDMEKKNSSIGVSDLWLAELSYNTSVIALKKKRVEYVQGMAALFQQFKVVLAKFSTEYILYLSAQLPEHGAPS